VPVAAAYHEAAQMKYASLVLRRHWLQNRLWIFLFETLFNQHL